MESKCGKLIMSSINKNHVDMDEYPFTIELQASGTTRLSPTSIRAAGRQWHGVRLQRCARAAVFRLHLNGVRRNGSVMMCWNGCLRHRQRVLSVDQRSMMVSFGHGGEYRMVWVNG
ncbi:hypothetical protein AHAS_Ahas11G0348200 [Arachis hypogaea]